MTNADNAETDHSGWIDRLVDLHVLAEHGDTAAAAQARSWIADDARAQHVWDSVNHTCDQLRRPPL